MILDDLTSRPEAKGLRAFCAGAQIVQVPFEVYPYRQLSDGRWGCYWHEEDRIPCGLEPLNHDGTTPGQWANPPFPHMVFFGGVNTDGPGIIITRSRPASDEDRITMSTARIFLEATLFGISGHDTHNVSVIPLLIGETISFGFPYDQFWAWYRANYPKEGKPVPGIQMREGITPPEDFPRGTMRDLLRAWILLHEIPTIRQLAGKPPQTATELNRSVAALETYAGNDAFTEKIRGRALNANGVLGTIATALSLLNCKNIEMIEFAPRQSRASRRRGDPPPYAYHVLRVHSFKRRRRGDADLDTENRVAVHWTRGHFKTYTLARPLFGRHVGLFWWQPHLTGRLHEVFSDKHYVT